MERIRRELAQVLVGRRITGIELLEERLPQNTGPEELEAVVGRRVRRVRRRGKYLLLDLEGRGLLVLHLRMSGRLLFREPGRDGAVRPSHVRLRLGVEGGGELVLVDPRRFGLLYWLPAGGARRVPGLAAMGPEPLGRRFTREELGRILSGRAAAVKAVLMDQRRLAGVGNIYADEALFRAGIRPDRPAGSLSAQEVGRLHQALRAVLREGIRRGGVTVRSYAGIHGEMGRFQEVLQVYGRKGEPCLRCGAPLRGARVSGRSSVYCPACQR
ncbi:bifunctional DNA-formamidopyrimidine glycosylase/DNA-(apurinic or apyrimidinic site) lyase [Limnochorda pilosa]|uniref:Formamidopyrimidine-DNA glycosylase n=1 Tax=Limnochorda pilosa TaxID=1555112 RepID=A0A0K2SJQ7_LIMPI|nr:bifunctional DNA-formamidopyrimidine glycosylase/DNA-(apurinic or apyrimidinic site) lyase [Limnochorda pilosa]BAS27346.1 formamidopyrimidine-DNA glycosylase [Limnochorda pilosa]